MSKRNHRARLENAIALPLSVTSFIRMDSDQKAKFLSTTSKFKSRLWGDVRQHYALQLAVQTLKSDYAELLYILWEQVWSGSMGECTTLDEMQSPDVWKEGGIWRKYQLGTLAFSTGIILDIHTAVVGIQVGVYVDDPKRLAILNDKGWTFNEDWESYLVASENLLMPVEETFDLVPLQEAAARAISAIQSTLPSAE